MMNGGMNRRSEEETDLRTLVYHHGEDGTTVMTRRAAAIQPALLMIQGEFPGRVHRLKSGSNLMGRDALCDICIRERAASRRHADIRWDGDAVIVEDLKSTNGTIVNGQLIREPVVPRPGNFIKIGSCVFKYIDSLLDVEMLEDLHAKGTCDPLTGIYNKAHLLLALASSMEIARDAGSALSLMVIDLDHFKKVNDTHGHLAGDYVLKETCHVIKSLLRPEDTFARFGGEEFTVMLPGQGLEAAVNVAERIRRSIAGHTFEYSGAKIPITLSLGVCEYLPEFKKTDDMISAADQLLYKSKHEGRNRVSAPAPSMKTSAPQPKATMPGDGSKFQ